MQCKRPPPLPLLFFSYVLDYFSLAPGNKLCSSPLHLSFYLYTITIIFIWLFDGGEWSRCSIEVEKHKNTDRMEKTTQIESPSQNYNTPIQYLQKFSTILQTAFHPNQNIAINGLTNQEWKQRRMTAWWENSHDLSPPLMKWGLENHFACWVNKVGDLTLE